MKKTGFLTFVLAATCTAASDMLVYYLNAETASAPRTRLIAESRSGWRNARSWTIQILREYGFPG